MINNTLERLHENKDISLEEKRAIKAIYNNLDTESSIDWDDLTEVTGIENLEQVEEILDLMHDLNFININYEQDLIIKGDI